MIGRVVAAILTIAFAVLSVPFLFLTTSHVVAGLPIGTSSLVVYLVYALVLAVLAAYWLRKICGRVR